MFSACNRAPAWPCLLVVSSALLTHSQSLAIFNRRGRSVGPCSWGGCSGEQPPREGSGAGGLSIARGEGEAGEEDESRLRDIFNIARLLGKCLGRAARAPGLGVCLQPPAAGAQLGGLERWGGSLAAPLGSRGVSMVLSPCCHALERWQRKGRLSPRPGRQPWVHSVGAEGGPGPASSSAEGRREGRKWPREEKVMGKARAMARERAWKSLPVGTDPLPAGLGTGREPLGLPWPGEVTRAPGCPQVGDTGTGKGLCRRRQAASQMATSGGRNTNVICFLPVRRENATRSRGWRLRPSRCRLKMHPMGRPQGGREPSPQPRLCGTAMGRPPRPGSQPRQAAVGIVLVEGSAPQGLPRRAAGSGRCSLVFDACKHPARGNGAGVRGSGGWQGGPGCTAALPAAGLPSLTPSAAREGLGQSDKWGDGGTFPCPRPPPRCTPCPQTSPSLCTPSRQPGKCVGQRLPMGGDGACGMWVLGGVERDARGHENLHAQRLGCSNLIWVPQLRE